MRLPLSKTLILLLLNVRWQGSESFIASEYNQKSVLLQATRNCLNHVEPSDNDVSLSNDNSFSCNRREAVVSALRTASLITGAATYPMPAYGEEVGGGIVPPSRIAVPTVQLGKSRLSISRTIQGYWQLSGGHGKYNPDEAVKNMQEHYKAGITTLDTADIYGPSEQILGRFLKNEPDATVCTKFCCFKFLSEIDRTEVRDRIKKVRKINLTFSKV